MTPLDTRPLWIAVVGPKKSGKTSLIEALIPYLKERGYRVATVKHSHHGHTIDRDWSDSNRHARAGAGRIVIISPAVNFYIAFDLPEREVVKQAEEFLRDYDVVICEGFRNSAYPKIVLEGDEEARKYSGEMILRRRLVRSGGERPVIPVEALDQIAEYVAERLKR
ncbi:MAG TPA: molybdopterin-guanine dinucleotide biosynthesis protein B [bacterium]|jgi:molybdopterin-guanine dinucleotide biosynthesis protein B